jgi:hypothetical protein
LAFMFTVPALAFLPKLIGRPKPSILSETR